jgi:hypothetical protein
MANVPFEGMTVDQLRYEIEQGGKFVQYQYCISLVAVSLKRFSKVTYVAPGESAVSKSLPFILLSLLLGWWGIPWGPIWTIHSLWVNLRGGVDLTPQIAANLGMPLAAVAGASS